MAISEATVSFFQILIFSSFFIFILCLIIIVIIEIIKFSISINNDNKYNNCENPIIENVSLNDSKEIIIKLNVSYKTSPHHSFKIYLKKNNGEIIELITGENKKLKDNYILIYGIAPGNNIIENGDVIKLLDYRDIILDKDGNKDFILNDK